MAKLPNCLIKAQAILPQDDLDKVAEHYDRLIKDGVSEEQAAAQAIRAVIQEALTARVEIVQQIERAGGVAPEPPQPRTAAPASEPEKDALVRVFVDRLMLDDGGFATIVEARKFAAENGFVKAEDTDNKLLEEKIELAVVLAARQILRQSAANGEKPIEAYRRLIALYGRQPRLGTRTSKSMAEQAFSTPVPIAFIASRLAHVADAATVLEPTAGNGMLLIEANPGTGIFVNELSDVRADNLRAQGFTRVRQEDATKPGLHHKGYPVDTVIANPPFGAVLDEAGSSTRYEFEGWTTTRIDYAIALNALQHIKEDGRAVLILGGPSKQILGNGPARKDFYNSKAQREFYYRLYKGYKVTDHFTIHGDLYTRQGAGWPIDVVVIEGKGESALRLPAVTELQVYDSFDALKVKIDDRVLEYRKGGQQVRPAHPAGPRPGGSHAGGGGPSGGSEPAGLPSQGGQPEPGPVPGGLHPGQPDIPQPGPPGGERIPRGAIPGGTRQPSATQRRPSGVEAEAANEGALQVPYEPASQKGAKLNTLVPTNMAAATRAALDAIGEDVDEFVAKHLGYDVNRLGEFFSAEQVDALALAIKEYQRGGALIIGDQTGIGKGRVVAGMIRFAIQQGQIPIFVTEKPNLYGDMYRDMTDIGMPSFFGNRPVSIFATNSDENIPLDEEAVGWAQDKIEAKARGERAPKPRGTFLKTGGTPKINRIMQAATPDNLAGYDMIFTTYDQINTYRGRTTERRIFLERMIPNAFLILDESHNAGGGGAGGWDSDTGPEDRATFLRRMVTAARGVMYSSATYAKRPDVMDLYSRTDMSKAVANPKDIGELIARGGVPMQQAVAAMLAENGQYIRRERNFKGITYALQEIPVDRTAYEGFIDSIRSIMRFDMALDPIRKQIVRDMLAEHGAAAVRDPSIGVMGAQATAFGSTMHNLVNQMLSAIKADGSADLAIAAMQRGEKPIVALSSTMESFIDDYADAKGIKTGDVINISYRDALNRYLQRSLRITVKDANNVKSHIWIKLEDLPADVRALFHVAEGVIEDAPIDSLPISPIDHLRHRINQAGYSVKEVTGRHRRIDYSQSPPKLVNRDPGEMGSSGKTITLAQYNNGKLDSMIINRSGSTGLSAHASINFKDKRPRHMIIQQAEGNIDTFMQLLGRINRTGQVVLPIYTQAAAAIPAEARPAAVLLKKMASLNASTTASRKGALTASNTVDFMNEYGDRVAAAVMLEHHDWHSDMGDPLRDFAADELVDAMAKVTGKMPLLRLADQEQLLNELTSNYIALIAQLDATGENALEAKYVDLQAIEQSVHELKPKTGPSVFEGAVKAEHSSVKSEGKSMGGTAVVQEVADLLSEADITDENRVRRLDEMQYKLRRTYLNALQSILENAQRYKNEQIQALIDPEAKVRFRERQEATAQRFQAIYVEATPGTAITLQPRDGEPLAAIVIGLGRTGDTKNPVALSSWEVKLAVPSGARQLTLPMSQIFPPGIDMPADSRGLALTEGPNTKDLLNHFDEAATTGREERWIITGNMLAAYDQVSRGRIISYSREDGSVGQGIIMPKGFDFANFIKTRPVWFDTPAQVMEFIQRSSDNNVISRDGVIEVALQQRDYLFEIEGARATGGKYFLAPQVREASQDRFVKVGSKMRARIMDPARARSIIQALMDVGASFGTKDEQDLGNEIVGKGKPAEPKIEQIRQGGVPNPFPKSKIQGVMYHGSPAALEEFKLPSGTHYADVMQGIWFTKDPKKASGYAWKEARRDNGQGGAVYPVYLNIQNPLVIKDATRWQKLVAYFKGRKAGWELDRATRGATAAFTPQERQRWIDAGYDGLVNEAGNEVVVFDPKQVRSATTERPLGGKRPHVPQQHMPTMARPVWLNPAVKAQLVAKIQAIAEQVLGHRIKLNIVDEIEHSGGAGSHTIGSYDFDTEQITVAIQTILEMGEDPIATVRHELIHALRHLGMITKPEWSAMRRWAKQHMPDPTPLYEHHRERLGDEQFEELISEEQVANGFGYHRSGKSPPAPLAIQRIMDKIIQFLTRLRNALFGAGFRTASDIFADIGAGQMRNRPSTGRFVRGERRSGPPSRPQRLTPEQQAAVDDTYDQMEESEQPIEAIRRTMPPSRATTPSFTPTSDRAMDHLMANNVSLLERFDQAAAAGALPLRRYFQDNMVDMRRLEHAVERQLGPLAANEHVYRTESLYPGRTGARLEELRDTTVQHILKKMVEEKVSLDDLWNYLAAKYAPDRNAYIASINPAMPDGGSGITNAEATQMMNDLWLSGKLQAAERVAQLVYRLRDQTRNMLLRNGIIDQQTHQQLYTEPWYVPFQGFAQDPDPEARLGLGMKYDTRASPIKRALGRRSKADHPLAYIISQAQQAIVLSEKARIGRAFLKFVQNHPNSDLWEVNQVTFKRRLANGVVATFADGREKMLADNVMAVRKDGKLYWITIHHDGLKQGLLGNSDVKTMMAVLRYAIVAQRYYAMMRTGYNPEFFIPNFLRDLQTAGVHISAEQGKAILKTAANPANLRKAIAATFKYDTMKKRNPNDPWLRMVDEQSFRGGRIASFGLHGIEDIKHELERRIRRAQGGAVISVLEAGETVRDWVGGLNGAIENGIRLSLYKAMRDAGFGQDESASASREVTVNFNRKGNGSWWANALYVFFQAGINGPSRVAGIMRRHPKVRRAMMGAVVMAVMLDLINSLLAPDSDDDGENDYDQMLNGQDWIAERNLIFFWPWSDKGERSMVPLPWGYNLFPYAGQQIGRLMRGKISPWDATANMMGALLKAFNPLQTIIPTLVAPYYQITNNVDWKNDPIYPELHGEPIPDSARYFPSVNPTAKWIAQTLNEVTGGDAARPGAIDVSPETLEYMVDFLTGGAGAFINRMQTTVTSLANGDPLEAFKIPFVRQVYGKQSPQEGRNEYYEKLRPALQVTENQWQLAIDSGDTAKQQMVQDKYGFELALIGTSKDPGPFKKLERELVKVNKAIRAATDNTDRNHWIEEKDRMITMFRRMYHDAEKGEPAEKKELETVE